MSVAPSVRRERLFRLILVGWLFALMIIGALAAEWGARYYERHRREPPDFFPQMYYPHQRLRYQLVPDFDYYGWFKINTLGFRGREISIMKKPGVFRIACVGGSTTFDVGSVGKSLPWPEVLESELQQRLGSQQVEVLNIGIPGATSLDSLIDLQMRVLKLQPDLLIVYQGHNDFFYSMSGPAPAQSSLYPSESAPRSRLVRWLRIHSVLFAKTEGRVFDRISGFWRMLFSKSSDRLAVAPRAEFLERGLGEFRANITSIAAIAQANKVPLVLPKVVLPFPQGAGKDCKVCADLSPLLANIPPDDIQAMFQRYDSVLSELAAQREGIYHIATDGFVPSEDRYYNDPVHFGPSGSQRMGVKMAEALLPLVQSSEVFSRTELAK